MLQQVTVGDNTCCGVGPNKKLAKRNAAEQMLQQLGYSRPGPQPVKPALKTGEPVPAGSSGSALDKKVTFLEPSDPCYGKKNYFLFHAFVDVRIRL